ncbi:MAG TPA: hypothetical protein VMU17_00850, partial [Elusimicrobiota bacterium]|nr:hypothetical protein [Elusimicrobiota bacterium]
MRLGLGDAVARRSAELINKAGQTQINGPHSTGLTGPVTFSVAPVDLPNVRFLQSLGNLNPPGHTFPTDHIYFYYNYVNVGLNINPIATSTANACAGGCPVYALADGFISEIQSGADYGPVANQFRVTFVYTDTFSSYYDHMSGLAPAIVAQAGAITPFGNLSTWIPVKAGQLVGSTGGVTGENALDLGVNDLQVA